jgi:hypothetical protein
MNTFIKIKSHLRKLDLFFSIKPELRVGKEDSHQTICGALLSLTIIILTILMSIEFGSDMVLREFPTIYKR